MTTLYCERSIFDSMKRAGKTGLRWAVIGGVAVPLAVRLYQVDANEAAAAVAVFLGSLTLVVVALAIGVKRLAAKAPADEKKVQPTLKMWVLVGLALFAVFGGTVAISTSISYVALSQLPIAWAATIAYSWSLGLWFATLISFLLVPIVSGVYVAIQHLDGWAISLAIRPLPHPVTDTLSRLNSGSIGSCAFDKTQAALKFVLSGAIC